MAATDLNSISIVISVHNGGPDFAACMETLAAHRDEFHECIIVDDASTDGATRHAALIGANLIRLEVQKGPANGRNIGARRAAGSILLFLDSDVCIGPDTIRRVRERFDSDPGLAALFGSYDAAPACPALVSQFRNLLHCFVHQTSHHEASTFWAGCGAIRRELFLAHNGFDVSYLVPSIEDIELGIRLSRAGLRVALDPLIQAKHLKRWTFRKMVVADIRRRGIPWTRLILASGRMPNDLNLRTGSRFSVALTGLLCTLLAATAISTITGSPRTAASELLASLVALALIVSFNLGFYQFLGRRRGYGFAAACIPLHLVYFFCCGVGFLSGIMIHMYSMFSPSPAAAPAPESSEP